MSASCSNARFVAMLLASASLGALPSVARAQEGDATAATSPSSPQPTAKAAQDKSVEAIVVSGRKTIGGGLMKIQSAPETTQSVTPALIAKKNAAASPLQLIANVPGANFGSSNAIGLGIRNFMSVRGLDESQMGWVVEGMPGQDQMLNYPYTETWADNENIADITLIPGTTRLHDPVETASGGEVIMTTRDPSDGFGGFASAGGGSFGAQRYFLRLDSGLLGATGVKMYGSYSYTSARNFILPGTGHKSHYDFKAVKDWSGRGTTKLYFAYTDWTDARLNTYTLNQFNTDKAAGDYTIGNYASTYTPGVSSSYYKSAYYNSKRLMTSLQNDIAVTDKLSLHVTPYYHYIDAKGGALSTYSPSSLYAGNQKVAINPSDVVITSSGRFAGIASLDDKITAYGVNSVGQYDFSPSNTLRVGFWYDHFHLKNGIYLKPVDLGARKLDEGPLYSTNGLLVSGSRFNIGQDIYSANIADTQTFLDDRLQINIGFKELWTRVTGINFVPGTQTDFRASMSKPLPRASISFKATPSLQVYANITTNTKPPIPYVTYADTYSTTTGVQSQVGNEKLPAEYAVGEELGARYYGKFNLDVALFNMKLRNHQLASSQNINGLLVQQAVNMGDETIRGATIEASTHRIFGFTPYANAQYLWTRVDNDLLVRGQLLPTEGNTMVQSPHWVLNGGLDFDQGPFFANLAVKHVSSQYATFMNDEKMPAYTIVDLSIGYRLPPVGMFHEPTIRLAMTNLNHGTYLSSIAGPQPNAKATVSRGGVVIAGAAPTYYIGAPFSAMATFSTSF